MFCLMFLYCQVNIENKVDILFGKGTNWRKRYDIFYGNKEFENRVVLRAFLGKFFRIIIYGLHFKGREKTGCYTHKVAKTKTLSSSPQHYQHI